MEAIYFKRNQTRAGWLKKQLEIQAEGLSGHLDKVWRDVRDSKWIGGDAEGWEESSLLAGWLYSAGISVGRRRHDIKGKKIYQRNCVITKGRRLDLPL